MLLNEFLEQSAYNYPDKIALICRDKKNTFMEIERAANSFCNALIGEGFKRQDRAVIYLDNSVESAVALFGILKAGGIFVIINPMVKLKKLEYILADCQARVLITDTRHLAAISEITPNLPQLDSVIITDYEKSGTQYDPAAQPRTLSYKKITEHHSLEYSLPCCIDMDLASLIYTSGYSGNPKGVMLTHHNMVSAANSVIKYLENNSDDIIMSTLPLAFSYGLYQLLMAFKFGGTLILEKAFVYPERIIDLVVKEKVTGWPMVPTIIAILLRLKGLDKHDFSRLRYITSASQALPPSHIVQLRKIFPAVKIFNMYGLTECKRVCYLPPEQIDKRPTSVGKAMPNTEAYIVNEQGEEITEAEIPGELVIRGSNVMNGYWNLPEETAKALRPGRYHGDKVLYTGDLFTKDEEGYLYYQSRKDDVINIGGQKVIPKEVENVLCEIEGVIEAAVIGIHDDVLGQAIKAFIHVADSSKANEKDIIAFCNRRLESFSVPRYITFCDEFPKTESGKVRKLDFI